MPTTVPALASTARVSGVCRVARPRMLPVRARVLVTVTVDPVAWSREYGTGTDPSAIRGDVAAYLRTAITAARIHPALSVNVTQEVSQ